MKIILCFFWGFPYWIRKSPINIISIIAYSIAVVFDGMIEELWILLDSLVPVYPKFVLGPRFHIFLRSQLDFWTEHFFNIHHKPQPHLPQTFPICFRQENPSSQEHVQKSVVNAFFHGKMMVKWCYSFFFWMVQYDVFFHDAIACLKKNLCISLDGHGNLLRRKDPLKEPSFGSWEGMYLWWGAPRCRQDVHPT